MTLAVAAAITLGPLQSRLRAESADALGTLHVRSFSPDFREAFKTRKKDERRQPAPRP